ncbi:hypothetical protein BX661DRAFT_172993 [Kickxella alabastrina]|uniref:uncharacterized protein n=1 Tax=Kickxella alabastrina TaxID=61397 RepID=UPI00221EA86A|nr:uncharacterized protein BX661DRAFT_172993 [Kickxella alabastrina]KAI7822417.1 hypothetical protein BX661DRAFT_172993 [Kickxella alabastrina]
MASTTVADCSAQPYCTAPGQKLAYKNQFVVQWNNQLPPLTTESLVTVAVYSIYDPNTPIYQTTGVSNLNGQITLKPDASWFSRYTGNNNATGEDQPIFFAAYLQGNDPPPLSSMLRLQLTATPEQYREIQAVLNPVTTLSNISPEILPSSAPSTASTMASSSSSTNSNSNSNISNINSSSSSNNSIINISLSKGEESAFTGTMVSDVDTSSANDSMSTNVDPFTSTTTSMVTTSVTVSTQSTLTATPTEPADANARGRHGLSGGAIAGIVIGSLIGLLLILLLLLLPLYRRRQRRQHLLAKSDEMSAAGTSTSMSAFAGNGRESAATSPLALAAGATGAAATLGFNEKRISPSDLPLLLAGKPNNSFTSHDSSLADQNANQVSTTAYQPLTLESPRILMNMPQSTRSRPLEPSPLRSPDPILSSDDARQIGDSFRDALRKPPSSEDDSEEPRGRDSMLQELDDELGEEEDPGWRERVASARMHRELEQEASVIRSVAMRAHGSDYSQSRPATSQSEDSAPSPLSPN